MTNPRYVTAGFYSANSLENSFNNSIATASEELKRLIALCSNQCVNLATKQRAGAMQTRFHVLFADFQALCSVGGTHSFDFPQHEHGPVVVRQFVKGFFQSHLQFNVIDLLFGITIVRYETHSLSFESRNVVV